MKAFKRVLAGILSLSIVFSGSGIVEAQSSKDITNENVSLDKISRSKKDIVKAVDTIAESYIAKGVAPSVQVYALKDGKVVIDKAYGDAQVYENGNYTKLDKPEASIMSKPRKAHRNTLYDLASVTKVVATTQAIMKLSYEGKLDVQDKVAEYLPGFEINGKKDVTIEQLLTHTSGMAQWVPSFLYVNNDRIKELEFIKNMSLEFEPGTYKYSDFGFMTLGYIVEAISGKDLDEYVETEIYQPLGMKDTMYNPLRKGIKKNRIAATSWGNPFEYRMVDEINYPGFGYDCTDHLEAFKNFEGWRKDVLVGLVNDGNAGMANDGIAGHAGVFSTAKDIAKLGQLMLNSGEYKDVKIYDQETIDLFTKNHLGTSERGYGFELGMSYMGEKASESTYGHNGFTGTHISIDPDNNTVIVVLTNKQNLGINQETGSYKSTFTFAKDIATAIQNELIK